MARGGEYAVQTIRMMTSTVRRAPDHRKSSCAGMALFVIDLPWKILQMRNVLPKRLLKERKKKKKKKKKKNKLLIVIFVCFSALTSKAAQNQRRETKPLLCTQNQLV